MVIMNWTPGEPANVVLTNERRTWSLQRWSGENAVSHRLWPLPPADLNPAAHLWEVFGVTGLSASSPDGRGSQESQRLGEISESSTEAVRSCYRGWMWRRWWDMWVLYRITVWSVQADLSASHQHLAPSFLSSCTLSLFWKRGKSNSYFH